MRAGHVIVPESRADSERHCALDSGCWVHAPFNTSRREVSFFVVCPSRGARLRSQLGSSLLSRSSVDVRPRIGNEAIAIRHLDQGQTGRVHPLLLVDDLVQE